MTRKTSRYILWQSLLRMRSLSRKRHWAYDLNEHLALIEKLFPTPRSQ